MYMKILYINDKNAKSFDKQVNHRPVFAKYFSPSCPACIAMETEWDDMCKDIDDKYNTDLLLAQIDPSGMKNLEKTHTYSDVDYVPHIVILEKGKKIKEYTGAKKKEDMIAFLMEGGYLKNKMTGGSKSKKNKHRKNRRSKKGSGAVNSTGALQYEGVNDVITNETLIEDALRENTMFPSYVETDTNIDNYRECVNSGIFKDCTNIDCRKSPGFFNKCIPKNRKFNPSITPETKINAENAYKKMIMIELFSSRVTNKIIENNFPDLLKTQLIPLKNSIKETILNGDYSDIDINNMTGFTKRLEQLISNRIDSAEELSGTLLNVMPIGGKRKNITKRKKSCRGKRDGKSGCRKCCKRKSKRKYTKCIKICMR